MSDNVKQFILCSHERLDGKGFPNHLASDKIPTGSMIVKLASELDSFMQIRMGQTVKTVDDIQTVFLERIKEDPAAFPTMFQIFLKKSF